MNGGVLREAVGGARPLHPTPRPSVLRANRRGAARALVVMAMSPLVIAACAPSAMEATAVEIPKAPRKPDGVLVEPAPARPRTADRAPAQGVVSLREPLSVEAVKDVVRAYIHAFEHEDIEALTALFVGEPVPLFGTRGARGSLIEQFRTRMKNYDYAKLAGVEVARLDQIERYEESDLGGPGVPERPPEMKPGDLLVRVPIATPRVGAEPLFGDVLVLLLRRDDNRFLIAGVAEENGP